MKHPVPKRRKSRSKGKRQYSYFVFGKQRKLNNKMRVQPCPECSAPKLIQNACPVCGAHRKGRAVVTRGASPAKVTKIKA